MAIDATVTSVTPTGLGRTLLALTIFFLIPTTIVIFLRCWIRLRHKIFGVDDGLMLVGWVSNTPLKCLRKARQHKVILIDFHGRCYT